MLKSEDLVAPLDAGAESGAEHALPVEELLNNCQNIRTKLLTLQNGQKWLVEITPSVNNDI